MPSILLVEIWTTKLTEILILFLRNKDLFHFRYVSIGDVAHLGSHPPNVAAIYRHTDGMFAPPVGYDLVRKFSQNCTMYYYYLSKPCQWRDILTIKI